MQSQSSVRWKAPNKTWVTIFLTFNVFHFTQSEVLGSEYWVKGLHRRSVDAHRILGGALLS